MGADSRNGGISVSAKITETVTKGMCLILDATNNWPYMLISTGDTVKPIAVAEADGVSGDVIPVHLLGSGGLVIGLGTAVENDFISPGASGLFQQAASGDRAVGIAVEAATAAEFRFIDTGVTGALVA